jgi:hypothetical protein
LLDEAEVWLQLGDLGLISRWSEFMGVVLKNLLTGETEFRGFSKSGFDFLLLIKTVGRS